MSTKIDKFYSNELEEGIRLLYFQTDSSKYPEGVKLIQRACDKNEPDAFYYMARCYAWENGNVKGDEQKAIEYSQKGASLGSDLCIIGADRFDALKHIQDVMQHSLKEAFDAVKEMALAGNPMAQYAIGLFYFWGDVIAFQKWSGREEFDKLEEENGKEGVRWFIMAAEQGCIPAFENVYLSARNGSNGIRKNVKAALKYVEQLQDKVQIPPNICAMIGDDYEKEKNTVKQIVWYEKGVAGGDSISMNNLGLVYLDEKSGYTDREKAVSLFMQGVEAGEPYSMHNLARCYFYGWGITQNQQMAFELFEKAAMKNVIPAKYFLGKYYEEGLGGIKKDMNRAISYYQQASDKGNTNARNRLAELGKGFGKGKKGKTGGRWRTAVLSLGVCLLVLALCLGKSGWDIRNSMPAADALEDKGVHTFQPTEVLPYSVKNTGTSSSRRTNPTRTEYRVTYKADDGSSYRFYDTVSSKSSGEELIKEGAVVERKVLYNKAKGTELYIDKNLDVRGYLAEKSKQSNVLVMICVGYLFFYVLCWAVVLQRKHEKKL